MKARSSFIPSTASNMDPSCGEGREVGREGIGRQGREAGEWAVCASRRVRCAHTLPRRALPLPQTETNVVDAVHMRFAQIEIVTNRCKHACESVVGLCTGTGALRCRGAWCAHLLGVECIVGEIDLGERGHREAREHGTLRPNCVKAGTRAHSGEQGNRGQWGCCAAAHLSLNRLSSFSRSWIALCFTFDWSRSLSAASILQVLASVVEGEEAGLTGCRASPHRA